MYKLILDNGNIFENLDYRDETIYSAEPIQDNAFIGMKRADIYDGDELINHIENPKVYTNIKVFDEYMIVIKSIPDYELANDKMDAQMTYTAMMTDTLIGD